MKLKHLENYLDFMRAVQECKGDVYFSSVDGDLLNLKSAFCQHLFAAICGDKKFLTQGKIICSRETDYQHLHPFLADAQYERPVF